MVSPNPTTDAPALRTEVQGAVGEIAGAKMAGAVLIREAPVEVIDCTGWLTA
jgi:hypothetical protein